MLGSAARRYAGASAPSSADLVAASIDQLFQAYVREVGPAGLQAVAYTGGHFVIRTGGTNTPESGLPAVLDPQLPVPSDVGDAAAPGKVSPAEFVARYANVQLEQGAPIKTEATTCSAVRASSLTTPTICSAGFGAFSASGQPLVLTAGHCAGDGTARRRNRARHLADGRRIDDSAGAPARPPRNVRVQPVRRPRATHGHRDRDQISARILPSSNP